jgi:5-methylcytosine-specific restriction protein A
MPTLPKPEKPKRLPGTLHCVANKDATQRVRGRKLQRRNERLYRSNPLCVRCLEKGKLTEATEWDHKKPLSQGGEESDINLQGLCHDCHAAKTKIDEMTRRLKVRGG